MPEVATFYRAFEDFKSYFHEFSDSMRTSSHENIFLCLWLSTRNFQLPTIKSILADKSKLLSRWLSHNSKCWRKEFNSKDKWDEIEMSRVEWSPKKHKKCCLINFSSHPQAGAKIMIKDAMAFKVMVINFECFYVSTFECGTSIIVLIKSAVFSIARASLISNEQLISIIMMSLGSNALAHPSQ